MRLPQLPTNTPPRQYGWPFAEGYLDYPPGPLPGHEEGNRREHGGHPHISLQRVSPSALWEKSTQLSSFLNMHLHATVMTRHAITQRHLSARTV